MYYKDNKLRRFCSRIDIMIDVKISSGFIINPLWRKRQKQNACTKKKSTQM